MLPIRLSPSTTRNGTNLLRIINSRSAAVNHQEAMIQVQGVFAELDKSMLAAKLRKAREAKKAKTGCCEGRKPYGFYEGEEEVVKRIKQLHRKPRGRRTVGTLSDSHNPEPGRLAYPQCRPVVWLSRQCHFETIGFTDYLTED